MKSEIHFFSGLRMRRSSRLGRYAFTLIELLIVISIILILSGISFKVMALVGNRAGVAKTTMILEQVRNALAAYYGTYGSYPPVNKIDIIVPSVRPVSITNNVGVRTDGLMAYLISGVGCPDLTRQYLNQEATRWEHYLEGLYYSSPVTNRASLGLGVVTITNLYFSINDAWNQPLRYMGIPPDYQSYILSSAGPTGNTNDDIYVTYQ